MVNDLNLTFRNLDEFIRQAKSDAPFAERAGLYGGLCAVVADLEGHIREEHDGDGYALEKLSNMKWHVAAIVGFDITNRHGESQHRSWAMGELSTLQSVLLSKGR